MAIGKRPVGRSQPGIVARNECTGNNQKERRADQQQRETMKTQGYCRLPIADFRFSITGHWAMICNFPSKHCNRRLPITQVECRQSAIGNRKLAIFY